VDYLCRAYVVHLVPGRLCCYYWHAVLTAYLCMLQAKKKLQIVSNLFHSGLVLILHESMGTTKAKNKAILNASRRIGIQDS